MFILTMMDRHFTGQNGSKAFKKNYEEFFEYCGYKRHLIGDAGYKKMIRRYNGDGRT